MNITKLNRTLGLYQSLEESFLARTILRLFGGLAATLLTATAAHATPPWEMLNAYQTATMKVAEATGDSTPRAPIQLTLNGPTITLESGTTHWDFRLTDYSESWCGVQEFVAEPVSSSSPRQATKSRTPVLVTLYDYSDATCGEKRNPTWELVAEAPIGHFRLTGTPTGAQANSPLVP